MNELGGAACQLILCLESEEKNKIDEIYVSELVRFFFKSHLKNSLKLNYLFLKGKHNYNHKNILKRIRIDSKYFKNNHVIYFLDKDKFDSSSEDNKFVDNVNKFCELEKFNVVWFVRDIENVCLGKQISNSEKLTEAIKFKKLKLVMNIKENNLKIITPTRHSTSNFLIILNKVFDSICMDD